MQFILDNLGATAISGVVILILASISINRAQGTRDVTRGHALQQTRAAFLNVLESDLTSAGMGASVSEAVHTADAGASFTPEFTFYGIADPVAGTGGWISYVVVPAGTADGSPVVSVERWIEVTAGARGTGTPVRRGGIGGALSRFELTALSGNDTQIVTGGAMAEVRQILVDTEWVVSFTESERAASRSDLRRSPWTTHIRPVALQAN